MEFIPSRACFKNASLRNAYCRGVVESFEAVWGHAELICVYQQYEEKLREMLGSDNEHDNMAADIINARYQGTHTRIDEQRQWVHDQLTDMDHTLERQK